MNPDTENDYFGWGDIQTYTIYTILTENDEILNEYINLFRKNHYLGVRERFKDYILGQTTNLNIRMLLICTIDTADWSILSEFFNFEYPEENNHC